MKKVKSILLKIELKGKGIVNFDGKEQKQVWNDNKLGVRYIKDNVSLGKKHLYVDNDGNCSYKLSISSNCLRSKIYDGIQSPNICHSDSLLMAYIGSPTGILRGYVYPDFGVSKTSALQISDAEQVNNSKSFIEFYSRSGEKSKNIEDSTEKGTSIFNKESVGDVVYESKGFINLSELQFISASDSYGRKAFNSDLFSKFKKYIKQSIPNFNSDLNYYNFKTSDIKLPEYGILLSNEDVNYLVKYQLKKILALTISRSKAYAQVTSLKIKYVVDTLRDKMESEDGWVDVTPEYIDNLNFDTEVFYELFDYDEAKKQDAEIKENLEKLNKQKKQKKDKEKEDKEMSKIKRQNISSSDDENEE